MKKTLKRLLASCLVAVMLLTTAPLSGFAGLELPEFNSGFLGEMIAKISGFFDEFRIKSLAANNSYATNDKITFGEYPQGEVVDSAIISALKLTSKHADGSYHYGNKRYAKVGSSWYVYEPIVWRVLSSNGKYVYAFSEKLLDAQPYHTSASSVTWENCSLNHWLNNEFYNTAFDLKERYCISTGTEAKAFSSGTSSNIFLLTYNDCINTKYGFNSSDTYDDSKRIAHSTAYSQAKGLGTGSCNWTIRSTSSTSQVSYSLAGDGCIGSCHGKTSVTTVMGIRPAAVFDTSSVFFMSSVKKVNEYALTIYDKDKSTVLKDISVDINGTKYTTSNKKDSQGMIFLNDLEDVMTIKVDGYYDYIFDKNTVNNKKKNIYIEKVKNSSKPYISSVHYKNISTNSKWKDASHEEIEIPRNSTEIFDIKIYAVDRGSKIKTIRLSQDGQNQIESSNGIFSSIQLSEKFLVGKDIVAYCIAEDGTVSKAYETKINIAPGGDDILENLKNLTEIGLVQDKSFVIPADIPFLGGSKLNLNVGTFPVNVTVDGDTVKIAGGVKTGYNFDEKEWDEYKGWVKTLQKNKDNLKSVRQAIGQKKHTWISSKGKWQMSDNLKFDVSFLFYWEGSVVGGQIVEKDTGGILTFEFNKTFRKGGVIWVIPCFVELGLKASLTATSSRARPVMDKTIPLEWAINIKFNPSVTAGICAGVPGLANAGIFGKAEFLWDIQCMDKYNEAYVTGKLYAQIRTLIWNSSEWDLINTKGKKWYWWQGTWGDESNETFSTNSVYLGEEIFNTESYEVADRSYLGKTQWFGGQTFSTNSISVGNYETKTLQTNIYDDSKQKLVDFGDQKMLVWITDNPNRSAVNRTMLVYSLYDSITDSWSEPLPVYDDGTADFYPDIISVDDQVYVAWNNLKASYDDDVDIETFASGAEICVAKYNQSTRVFENIKNITSNGTLDTSPILASDGTDVRVIWSNNDANDFYGLEGNNSIMCATLSNGEWINTRTLQTGLTAIHSLDAALKSDTLYVSYAYDMDNDYNNFDDVEIFQIIDNSQGTNISRLTNNSVLDSAPHYEFINGEIKLFWYSENNLHSLVSLNEKTTETVFENDTAVNDSYVFAQSDIGTNYIIWPQSVGENIAFYSSAYENDGWSEPVLLGSSNGKVLNPTAVVNDDGTLYVAYNNIEQVLVTIEGDTDEDDISYYENGQTDLCIMQVNQNPDIEVSDENLIFNYSDVIPGAEIPMDLTVTNNSLILLNSLDVYVDGELIETVAVELYPGQTSEFSVNYTLPSTIAYDVLEVTVLPSKANDSNDKNNSVSIEYGYSELSVNSVTVSDTPLKKIISATITNESAVDSGKFNVVIHENDQEGPVVYEETVNGLVNGSELLISFEVFKEDLEYSEDLLKSYYVEVVTEEKEYLTGNNINCASFSKEDNEGLFGEIHEITFNGSIANVYATVTNNTLDFATQYAKIEVFDSAGNLIGVYLERLSLSEKELYTIDVMVPLSGNYTEGTATIEIIESGNKDISIEIPDGVTEILDNQFANCSDLVQIKFPSTVKKIGNGAFSGCTGLTEVILSENTQEIGSGAFTGCGSLASVWIPETLELIGEETFRDCPKLVLMCFDNDTVTGYARNANIDYRLIYGEYNDDTLLSFKIVDNTAISTGCIRCLDDEIVIPETIRGYTVTAIGGGAFSDYYNLKYVYLPETLTSIDYDAFYFCVNLKEVVIPDSVIAIGDYAFGHCENLKEVVIPDSVIAIGDYAFDRCEKLETVTIGKSVEEFGRRCFRECRSLKTVYYNAVDAEVESNIFVKYYPFYDCTAIEKCIFSNDVEVIPKYLFYKSTALTDVVFGSNITSIGTYAFYGCSKLNISYLPKTTITIESYAFYGCASLSSCNLSNNLESIGASAFRNCSSIYSAIIPDSVSSIGSYAFSGCTNLTDISIANDKASVYGNSFDSTAYYNDESNWKDGLLYIDNHLITGKDGLTSGVVKSGTISIANSAFSDDINLTRITIPKTVKLIGTSAFSNCTGLTSVTVPAGVERIESSAFTGCTSLGQVSIYNKDCIISNSSTVFPETTILCGYSNSTTQEYATNFSRTFVSLHEHDYSYIVKVGPTVMNEGYIERSCSCGDAITEAIPAIAQNCIVKNNMLIGLDQGLSVEELLEKYLVSNTATITLSRNVVGTGTTVEIINGDGICEEYEIVIIGDVNGDSWHDGQDAVVVSAITNGVLTEAEIGSSAYIAADCNADGKVDDQDVALLQSAGLMIDEIDQTNTYGDSGSITVTFNGNGATDGTMESQNFEFGVEQNLKSNEYSRSYKIAYELNGGVAAITNANTDSVYSFKSWNSTPNGNGLYTYSNGEAVTNPKRYSSGNAELYAQWRGGGIKIPTPTKEHNDFVGWYTDHEFKNEFIVTDELYYPTENITLYAKWQPHEFEVTFNDVFDFDAFDFSSVSNGMVSVDKENKSVTLYSETWDTYTTNYADSTRGYMTLIPGHTYSFSYDWKNLSDVDETLLPYAFAYDSLEITGLQIYRNYSMFAPAHSSGVHVFTETIPEGYPYVTIRFGVSGTENGGSIIKFSNVHVQDITNLDGVVDDVSVPMNTNGETIFVVSVGYGDKISSVTQLNGSLPTITRTGYTFAGWYDAYDENGNGTGNLYDKNSVMGATDLKLYAKWIKEE